MQSLKGSAEQGLYCGKRRAALASQIYVFVNSDQVLVIGDCNAVCDYSSHHSPSDGCYEDVFAHVEDQRMTPFCLLILRSADLKGLENVEYFSKK